MVTKVVPVRSAEILAAGDNYVFNFTLTKDGATYNITGFTISADIYAVGVAAAKLSGLSLAIVTGSAGTVTLTLTKAQSTSLETPAAGDFYSTIEHIVDVKVVESASIDVHCGPFSFPVRRKVTA